MSFVGIELTIYRLLYDTNALLNSPTEGIKMLPLNVVVKVKASEWELCLDRIQSLCSTKWNKCRKLRARELMYGETKKCHREGFYISDRNVCFAQKDTKLCYCEVTIFIKQYINNPEVILICMINDHTNYVSGDASEIRTLPLPSEAIKIIEDQLKGGSTCRNTRISMKNFLYKFHPDENKSLDIWMREKLPSQNYCIFSGDLSACNNNAQHFAFGFQSSSQMMLMRISESFCLDATHNISARNIEILYSLVTHHSDTAKGSSVAYIITNDHSVGPINQWLHNLDSKVKLDASYTSEQPGKYKYELKEFRHYIQSQQQFLAYFEHKLIGTEELLRRWERPYVANDHQRYLTNNYIES
ncbi:hypothetical protein PHYBLDRAFT_140530 [Phycomyces blakesleeanus NRRL 1555(-)]|uniref:Uncharacterized protein n=1 Tax=Phycomyces blakesleeanus (strain ATCC 8743b / DSM 1359 / FGSC 10004 / NBRC 33097 / NRRL 1555) TaxID=763407 RepID=A0A162UWL1_PHYB8|nr:hypothetical protein PHYBLDRAFT_140530 [Phycomyces blakesleeanus NRRL 1555(-)]OAD78453.1 hypothetical protein PHYBLDRAFT_140530 [Phycomyces blakesleeanus NRRL 1555(-)]|eukprot:XP_018296493.1 hypothetical protein PHYBLDRAFT_140530 [Phycomyces blakesleeanus NRRL 1555(-)]